MTKTERVIAGRECFIYECGDAGSSPHDVLLIQPVDDHDLEVLDSEVAEIIRLTGSVGTEDPVNGAGSGEQPGGAGFTLAAFRVNDWNDDLSPWEASAVFGDRGFGGGAEETLRYVTDELIPVLTGRSGQAGSCSAAAGPDGIADPAGSNDLAESADPYGAAIRIFIGGYSLAGFFALWAAYQTDIFEGAAAASPSVWFPGWISYAAEHAVRARSVYLSLGDKEEKTRNPVMRTVGDCIRKQRELLEADPGCDRCILEMNPGNHFREPDIRTAKGFAWLLGGGIW